jgi:hypothetical protein
MMTSLREDYVRQLEERIAKVGENAPSVRMLQDVIRTLDEAEANGGQTKSFQETYLTGMR